MTKYILSKCSSEDVLASYEVLENSIDLIKIKNTNDLGNTYHLNNCAEKTLVDTGAGIIVHWSKAGINKKHTIKLDYSQVSELYLLLTLFYKNNPREKESYEVIDLYNQEVL